MTVTQPGLLYDLEAPFHTTLDVILLSHWGVNRFQSEFLKSETEFGNLRSRLPC